MDQLGSFFYAIRKVLWIIPIGLIVIAAVLYRKTEPAKTVSVPITPVASGTIAARNTATQQAATTAAGLTAVRLDLKGPWNCTFLVPEATVSAHISNSRIAADLMYQKTVSHYLVQGDCLYQWADAEKQGKETCGVGQYISMAQVAQQTGLLTTTMISQYLPQILGHSMPTIDVSKLQQSCLNTPVVESSFVVPTQIQFVKQ